MGLRDLFINWPKTIEKISVMANDPKIVESLVEDQLQKLLLERHPNDYKEFQVKHANELGQIKKALTEQYDRELRQCVETLRKHKI